MSRYLIAQLFSLSCLALLLPGCASMHGTTETGIKHVVFCWLKQPGDEQLQDKLLQASRELSTIPGVIDISAGRAVPSDRPIVDDSFDIGIVMSFSSHTAMQEYLVHPEHIRRVQEVILPLCQRIQVYDIAI